MRHAEDSHLPIDTTVVKTLWQTGTNLLFAGNLRAGRRAAIMVRLIHSARSIDHDAYAYL